MSTLQIIRGDTLQIPVKIKQNAAPADLTGWVITSQIRKPSRDVGAKIADLTVTIPDVIGGEVWLSALPSGTKDWPVGSAEMDLELTRTSDGFVTSSPKITVLIVGDVTRV
jgi:hypothetical protein